MAPFHVKKDQITVDSAKLLGKGRTSEVYAGTLLVTVKKYPDRKIYEDERQVLEVIKGHPSIIGYLGYAQSSSACTVLERIPQDLHMALEGVKISSNLSCFASEKIFFYHHRLHDWKVVVNILLQIAEGVAHVQAKNYSLLELNPSHIAWNQENIKICNFEKACIEGVFKEQPTSPYAAPELRNSSTIPKDGWKKFDVYSLGRICQEVLQRIDAHNEMISEMRDLAERCVLEDPIQRPSITEVVAQLLSIEQVSSTAASV